MQADLARATLQHLPKHARGTLQRLPLQGHLARGSLPALQMQGHVLITLHGHIARCTPAKRALTQDPRCKGYIANRTLAMTPYKLPLQDTPCTAPLPRFSCKGPQCKVSPNAREKTIVRYPCEGSPYKAPLTTCKVPLQGIPLQSYRQELLERHVAMSACKGTPYKAPLATLAPYVEE